MGRRIFVVPKGEVLAGPLLVTGFKRFLPAGPVASGDPSSYDGIRTQHLLQVYTDHGMRTLAVADVHLKNPRKRRTEAA